MRFIKYLVPILIAVFVIASCDINDSGEKPQPQKSDYKLVINEYLASNDACCADENGEFDDWFEIYNYGDKDVDLGGMYVSDSKSDITKYQIPTGKSEITTVKAGGFIVIWCDGQPEQGPLHASFKLSSGGEDIVLTESNGVAIIDEVTFGPQDTDVSEGRDPDGSNNWKKFTNPTPGKSNSGSVSSFPPSIKDITVSPATINPGDEVTVSAKVTDEDGDLNSVKIYYGKDIAQPAEKDMTGDGDVYTVSLGTYEDGSVVYFYIKADDKAEHVTVSDTVSFEVGFVPPQLYINEFLASNDSSYYDSTTQDYPDWIEIYNAGNKAVDIGGYYITDDLTDLTAWQIPEGKADSTTIQPKGFLLLIADKKPEAGVLHVKLKLSSGGEQIGLTAPNGTTVIDSLSFGEQTTDVSQGRLPDGSDNWEFFTTPTPGESNHK